MKHPHFVSKCIYLYIYAIKQRTKKTWHELIYPSTVMNDGLKFGIRIASQAKISNYLIKVVISCTGQQITNNV